MKLEILTPSEMGRADRRAAELGPFDGVGLMQRAGAAVAEAVLARFPHVPHVHVLCGPGNNGGDGYCAATILARCGVDVSLWADGATRPGSDAAIFAAQCPVLPGSLGALKLQPGALVVDALFGAGLARPLEGAARAAVEMVNAAGLPVVAVDLPSGVSGESGEVLEVAFHASLTVTFVRKKPGHLLYPGRALCGELIVHDIGIADSVVDEIGSRCRENAPPLWLDAFPHPADDTYKYRRGHVGVFSGGLSSTGAARLAAMAAARIGSGAVTLLSPPSALAVNAAHLTSIILRKVGDPQEALAFLEERRPSALVIGPGFGISGDAQAMLRAVAESGQRAVVMDADALTMIGAAPDSYFRTFSEQGEADFILTPHEGEFRRLFPDIHSRDGLSKLEKARAAAEMARAVIVYKGPDTVIATLDGRAAVNSNGTPLLATAGSGDVLSGIIGGLVGQGMPAFEAACAAVWIHAEAARRFGPGLIAEDLPGMLPAVLADLLSRRAA